MAADDCCGGAFLRLSHRLLLEDLHDFNHALTDNQRSDKRVSLANERLSHRLLLEGLHDFNHALTDNQRSDKRVS